MNIDHQIEYWNREGPSKPLAHPVNLDRLKEWLRPESRILDYGCGYGRVLGMLQANGYSDLIGVDPSTAMIAAARSKNTEIEFAEIPNSPRTMLENDSVD